MKNVFRVMLVAALAGVCTQASAQSRLQGDRYEMVNTQQYQNSAFGASNSVYGGVRIQGSAPLRADIAITFPAHRGM